LFATLVVSAFGIRAARHANAASTVTPTASAGNLIFSEGEDKEITSPRCPSTDVGKRGASLPNVIGQIRGDVSGDQQSHVPADSCINRDILLPVGTGVCHRIADHSRSDLELPQDFSRSRI